jgi:hypothetical protein
MNKLKEIILVYSPVGLASKTLLSNRDFQKLRQIISTSIPFKEIKVGDQKVKSLLLCSGRTKLPFLIINSQDQYQDVGGSISEVLTFMNNLAKIITKPLPQQATLPEKCFGQKKVVFSKRRPEIDDDEYDLIVYSGAEAPSTSAIQVPKTNPLPSLKKIKDKMSEAKKILVFRDEELFKLIFGLQQYVDEGKSLQELEAEGFKIPKALIPLFNEMHEDDEPEIIPAKLVDNHVFSRGYHNSYPTTEIAEPVRVQTVTFYSSTPPLIPQESDAIDGTGLGSPSKVNINEIMNMQLPWIAKNNT